MKNSVPSLPKMRRGVLIKHITGWVGYAVSTDGTIWSCKPKFGDRLLYTKWRKMKLATDIKGYVYVQLSDKPNLKKVLVSRIVLLTFVGDPPKGYQCCHNNGDKSDNSKTNLRWDTCSNNHLDKIRHGTSRRGESHPNSKLCKKDVLEIRKRFNPNSSSNRARSLAIEFGVSEKTIRVIHRGSSWNHIKYGRNI